MKAKRYTPLRYPGGKAKLAPFIKKYYKEKSFIGNVYAEPYAGGAGVALDLLFSGFCSKMYINDIDKAIYSFWRAITEETEQIINRIRNISITIEEWHKQKHIINNIQDFNFLDVGFATFFLNRTNYSGILKGGIIGGKQQKGKYKMDSRFNKEDLIERIEKIANRSSQIYIYNMDALDFLKLIENKFSFSAFVYLDPPYYVKGQGLYRNFYDHGDHVAIRNFLSTFECNWLLSYDNCLEIKNLYKSFFQMEYSLNYSANRKTRSTELIISNEKLVKESLSVLCQLTFPQV